MSVPLLESAGAAGEAGQPQVTTMGGPDVHPPAPSMTSAGSSTSERPTVDFQPGGGMQQPVIRIRSTVLGYEDIIMIMAIVQAVATAANIWLGGR